jgi:hypothetical protein
MGKIGGMTCSCIDIVSLKTFYEKPLWEKTHRRKRVQYDV